MLKDSAGKLPLNPLELLRESTLLLLNTVMTSNTDHATEKNSDTTRWTDGFSPNTSKVSQRSPISPSTVTPNGEDTAGKPPLTPQRLPSTSTERPELTVLILNTENAQDQN